MSQVVRYQLWIAVAASVIFFTNLGAAALFDMDEALYTTCAREMLERGNLIVPWFNGAMFPEKPPLMFWTMMGGFELCGGVDELGARLFSALFGVGTALVAFHLGRILFSARVGLWAGLITASTIVFTISARAATVDSALTFFTTLAFLTFVMGWRKSAVGGGRKRESSNQQSTINNHQFPLFYAVATYACIGVAVLGKGPVGMLLPLAAMGLFLLATNGWEKKGTGTICRNGPEGAAHKLYLSPFSLNGWRSFFRSAWWMRPLTMIVVIAAVAAPWYVAVGYATDGEWLKRFFLDFNLRPFRNPFQGHGAATAAIVSFLYYLYYIPAILIGFFPWSVFLGPTLVDTVRRLREGKNGGNGAQQIEAARWRVGVILAVCWFGTWFVLWSLVKTKLPHYLLPAYPALALLTACFIDRWLAAEKGTGPIRAKHPEGRSGKLDLSPFPPPWALRNAWISMLVVGTGIVIAIPILADGKLFTFPVLAKGLLPGEGPLGQLGLLLVLGGAWCWWKTSRKLYTDAAITFAITSVAFLTAVFGFAALRVDQFQNAKPMMAKICADENGEEKAAGIFGAHPRSPIATYCFFRESTVYYSGKPVTKCDDDEATHRSAREALAQFLAEPGRSYVITTDEYEPALKKAFSDRLKVIYREPRFLADGEMVIFRHGE
jgi:4-amino-4-deoxy-L-arabinose transferase-like glycosyltransferase